MFSLIVPIFNDGWLANDFVNQFDNTFKKYLNIENIGDEVELIFVNDGSTNDSIEFLKSLSKIYSYVKVIDLSRNFGQHIALTAGYEYAKGDFVGMMNVDLQEEITEFIKLLDFLKNNPDYDFALGLREQRNDSLLNKFTSSLFNRTLNYLTNDTTPFNSSTVRVMSRKFINAYIRLSEKDRYLPALETWLGFKQIFIPITHNKRDKGKSSYNFYKRLKMAINAIVTFSDKPIKIASAFGFLIALIGFIMGVRLILMKLFFTEMQRGYTSTLTIIIFVSGLQIMFLGLTAIYIGKILKEVLNRPLYIVKDTFNFKDNEKR